METFYVKLSIWLMTLTALFQIHGYEGCLEKERTALLEIKAFFKSITDTQHTDDILPLWIGDRMSDCCDWERVRCNATTQRVIELNLTAIKPNLDGYSQLNLSLFIPFEELQTLDLSSNYFEGFYMNNGSYSFEGLKQLNFLDLSYNFLNDSILPYLSSLTSLKILFLQVNDMVEVFKSKQGLGNLTELKILDLKENRINGSLQNQGLCDLKNLVELDLSRNHVDGHIPYCLSNFTNLKFLDLSYNQLSGNLLPSTIPNFISIEYLSLRENNFQGSFSFTSLANLSKLKVFQLSSSLLQIKDEEYPRLPTFQLKFLSLYNCSLHAIPHFLLQQFDLRFLDLSDNMLFGDFPTWLLQNNTKLQALYLRNNSLSGILRLPKSQHGLLRLTIFKNYFDGQLPIDIGMILPLLMVLKISENNFEGSIPSSIGEMKSLQLLDMSDNNFSGELPRELVTSCTSLLVLKLSHNKFQGQVFPKYMNLTKLQELYWDNNHFSGKIQDGLSKATSLSILDISNNILLGESPKWIGNFSSLDVLLMSNNLLEGNFPVQMSNLIYLRILDISENRLFGSMTLSLNFSSLEYLYMHKNDFSGSIPSALQRCSRLVILDLRNNQLSGSIPHWIDELSRLRILLLRGNHLQGYISNQLCRLKRLSILDLSNNKFNGLIPSCFTNMTLWTQLESDGPWFNFMDKVSSFAHISNFKYPTNLSIHFNFSRIAHRRSGKRGVEFMTKNRYESYESNILNYMTGLDLSSNELTGDIPSELGKLQCIHALNLSHNCLSGSIPKSFSNLKMIESLDLSGNKLSGRIPPQLTELYNLAIFNVSYNNLSGLTPNKGQFANFDESNYAGNPYLCGPSIKKSCNNIVVPTTMPSSEAEGDESAINTVTFYWSFVASCVSFLLALVVILWVNLYWRRQWFAFIDECIDSCLY